MRPQTDDPCPLSPLEKALLDSLNPSRFRDVHLYAFSRRTTLYDGSVRIHHPLPIVAVGSMLKETEYFLNLLTSGFEEASNEGQNEIWQYAHEGEYDYESDSDLDEFEELDDTQTPVANSSSSKGKLKGLEEDAADPESLSTDGSGKSTRTLQRIPIRSHAYRTLKACVFYLYTGRIDFLPLTSKGSTKPQFAASAPSGTFASPCSPKSMYRLADAYGINTLRHRAYDEIVCQLNAQNVVPEAFSKFFSRYERLREHAMSYISQNYSDPGIQGAFPLVIKRLVEGELPHAGDALQSLLGLRMVLAPPVTVIQPSRTAGPLPGGVAGQQQWGRSASPRQLNLRRGQGPRATSAWGSAAFSSRLFAEVSSSTVSPVPPSPAQTIL